MKMILRGVSSANFGNVFAGYMAYQMGLPVKQFVIATNANDILHRTLADNDFAKRELAATLAPSMDIVVSSNFERLLFDAYQRDGEAVRALLERFQHEPAALAEAPLARLRDQVQDLLCLHPGSVAVCAPPMLWSTVWKRQGWRICRYLIQYQNFFA